MPIRKEVIATGQVYHIFNKSVDGKKVFEKTSDLKRAELTLWYYRFSHLPVRISKYLLMSWKDQVGYVNALVDSRLSVQILAYCLMPNHFHLVIKQLEDGGITKYLANFQNSYTRHFNQSKERLGAIFLSRFKAVRIESDEQLLHVIRYVHLNPHTGYVIRSIEQLENYPWSSWQEYMGTRQSFNHISEPAFVLDMCGGKEGCRQFVFDQANYQRGLKKIEHLVLE